MLLRLAIPLALVALALDVRADVLKLANGDTLNGEVVNRAVDHVILDHPQLGRIRLSLDQLEIDTGEPPTRGLFNTRFLRGWKRHIDLGLSGKEGDGGSSNVRVNLRFGYQDPFKRWNLSGRYFYQSSNGNNDNNARLDLSRDWLLPESRWFAFVASRYQFDQLEEWKHRTVLAAGPGFHIVQTEHHSLDARLGPAYTREWEGEDQDQFEAVFSLTYDWTISAKQSFSFSNQLFPTLAPDTGDIRNLTLAEWRIRLTENPALSLNLGAENEFRSNPDAGDDNNILNYYLSLGLDF